MQRLRLLSGLQRVTSAAQSSYTAVCGVDARLVIGSASTHSPVCSGAFPTQWPQQQQCCALSSCGVCHERIPNSQPFAAEPWRTAACCHVQHATSSHRALWAPPITSSSSGGGGSNYRRGSTAWPAAAAALPAGALSYHTSTPPLAAAVARRVSTKGSSKSRSGLTRTQQQKQRVQQRLRQQAAQQQQQPQQQQRQAKHLTKPARLLLRVVQQQDKHPDSQHLYAIARQWHPYSFRSYSSFQEALRLLKMARLVQTTAPPRVAPRNPARRVYVATELGQAYPVPPYEFELKVQERVQQILQQMQQEQEQDAPEGVEEKGAAAAAAAAAGVDLEVLEVLEPAKPASG